jgi:hypothetical protein
MKFVAIRINCVSVDRVDKNKILSVDIAYTGSASPSLWNAVPKYAKEYIGKIVRVDKPSSKLQ